MVLSRDNLLNGEEVLQSALQGYSPCAGQGLQGMGRVGSAGASSTSRWVPGLDRVEEEMGAPLAFTPRHAKAITSTRC